MQKEINFYQEMASEHRLQEYSKGPVPLYFHQIASTFLKIHFWHIINKNHFHQVFNAFFGTLRSIM